MQEKYCVHRIPKDEVEDYRKDEVKDGWMNSSSLQPVHSCPSLPTPASKAVFAAVGTSFGNGPDLILTSAHD